MEAKAIETVAVTVNVPKETHELAKGIAKLVKVGMDLKKDGFQAGSDLPAFAVAALAEFPSMIGGIDKLQEEIKADKGAFALALAVELNAFI